MKSKRVGALEGTQKRSPRVPVDPDHPLPEVVRRAARVLAAGSLVALPTDTLYGLAADGLNAAAVARAMALKGRPGQKPLGLLIAEEEMAGLLAEEISPLARLLIKRFWPGPLSIVVAGRGDLPPGVTGQDGGVSLRVPASPLARSLILELGRAITATSANLSGGPDPVSADQVEESLGRGIDLILDGGPCRANIPSTVLDARGEHPRLIREGAIPWAEILSVLAETREGHLEKDV